MNPDAFDAHACADGVDTLVVTHNRHFGAIAGDAGNLFDLDDAVVDLRYFNFEQALHEDRRGAAHDHLRIGAGVAADFLHNRAQHITLAVVVARNLLISRENDLDAVVHQQRLVATNLVDLTDDDLAHELGVLVVNLLLFDVADALAERLASRQHGAAPEVANVQFARDLIIDLEVFVDLLRVALLNLGHGIDQVVVLHNLLDMENLDIALARIKDDLKRFIRPVPLIDHRTNHVFDDDLERLAVNVFRPGNFPERRNEVCTSHSGYCRFRCRWWTRPDAAAHLAAVASHHPQCQSFTSVHVGLSLLPTVQARRPFTRSGRSIALAIRAVHLPGQFNAGLVDGVVRNPFGVAISVLYVNAVVVSVQEVNHLNLLAVVHI